MADEEVISKYRKKYLCEIHLDIFSKKDFILISGEGDPERKTFGVAEKNICWLRFTTEGKQSLGSRPGLGMNAFHAACYLALKDHGMADVFNKEDLHIQLLNLHRNL